MDVTLFDFDLPEDRIALRPARPRDSARMLVVRPELGGDAALAHATARDLPDFLNPGDVLVFNDTRVIPARLHGRRGEAGVEVTLHQHVGGTSWKVFARPARKCRVGDRLVFGDLAASVTAQGDGGERTLAFDVAEEDFAAALEQAGIMPLPPYIASKRAVDALDEEDYQTAFADRDGSVAAPTAGLHFTDGLLAALDARGVRRQGVTLHVGAGTFLPVKATDTRDHKMHSEWGEVSAEAAARINAARAAGGRVVAVGTTSMRLLESAVDENGILHPFAGETDIFITPGFRFRAVDVLMTNFHLPKSTLFMLVSAFSGLDMMKRAYGAAVEKSYRFYSYGDASLLHRPEAGTTDGSEGGAEKS